MKHGHIHIHERAKAASCLRPPDYNYDHPMFEDGMQLVDMVTEKRAIDPGSS